MPTPDLFRPLRYNPSKAVGRGLRSAPLFRIRSSHAPAAASGVAALPVAFRPRPAIFPRHRIALALLALLAFAPSIPAAAEFFVSPTGHDAHPGTRDQPFATLERARDALRAAPRDGRTTVWLRGGAHRLARTLVLEARDGGRPGAPVVYAAAPGETAEISGAQALTIAWTPDAAGRWQAAVPDGTDFDQLFADGTKLIRARYPNFNPVDGFFGGLSRDATDPERLRRYANPVGMFIHGYHGIGWGSVHFEVREKSPDGRYTFLAGKDPRLAGGWQNKGRALTAEAPLAPDQRFVENVFEELDAPGEWFLDRTANRLWLIPPAGADPRALRFEAVRLAHLVEVRGTPEQPVAHLSFHGLEFRRARYTFMEADHIPSGGDWRIHRGAAVIFDGVEDCAVRDCRFEGIGGNAIFVRDYARRVAITGCEFRRIGASAVLFEGDPGAMRSRWAHSWGWPESAVGPRPLVDGQPVSHPFMALLPEDLLATARDGGVVDTLPGPRNHRYPARSLVHDCLMAELGTVEKQISGVFLSKAHQITLSHLTIHDVPRAAININDGCWGGHVVEWCDVFNTCLESREHGAINTWGRDRYWLRMTTKLPVTPAQWARLRDWARLDAVDATWLRFNRVQCARGYDIDLDDGSSHYVIENNLCLEGGIKLREGFFRTVRNNLSPLFSPHVWYPDSRDTVTHNLFTGPKAYDPRGMAMADAKDGWFDFNLFATYVVPAELRRLGFDRHSLTADPQFVDPAAGDYRVRPGSPAEQLGFANFPMDRFGVVSPRLKARSRTWEGLGRAFATRREMDRDSRLHRWQGAVLRNLLNRGAESAIVTSLELADDRGILIKSVTAESPAARAHLPVDAVILAVNDHPVADLEEFSARLRATAGQPLRLKILTAQGLREVVFSSGGDAPVPDEPATRHRSL